MTGKAAKRKRRRALGQKVRGNLSGLSAAARERICQSACLDLSFRAQHDPLGEGESAVECIAEGGAPGATHRTRDTLDLLKSRGTISDQQLNAGRRFESDFRLAQLDRLKAIPLIRLPGGPGELADGVIDARRRIGEAMAVLGWGDSALGAAAWNILGLGMSLVEHAEGSILGPGRSLERRVATGIFVGSLGVLQLHYSERRKKTA